MAMHAWQLNDGHHSSTGKAFLRMGTVYVLLLEHARCQDSLCMTSMTQMMIPVIKVTSSQSLMGGHAR